MQVENNQEYAKILENTFDLENYKKEIFKKEEGGKQKLEGRSKKADSDKFC